MEEGQHRFVVDVSGATVASVRGRRRRRRRLVLTVQREAEAASEGGVSDGVGGVGFLFLSGAERLLVEMRGNLRNVEILRQRLTMYTSEQCFPTVF